MAAFLSPDQWEIWLSVPRWMEDGTAQAARVTRRREMSNEMTRGDEAALPAALRCQKQQMAISSLMLMKKHGAWLVWRRDLAKMKGQLSLLELLEDRPVPTHAGKLAQLGRF